MSQSGPSFTALVVIRCLVALTKMDRWQSLVSKEDAGFYRHCLEDYRTHNILYYLFYILPSSWIVKLVDVSLVFGAPQHYAFRKRAIKEQVTAYAEQGYRQIVNLGAGFDILLHNLSVQSLEINCIEIDTPAMHSVKKKLISSYFGESTKNYTLIGADLSSDSLLDVLGRCDSYDKNADTVFIAEGVSMYLRGEDMQKLLSDIKQVAPHSCFIFTAIEPKPEKKSWLWRCFHNWLLGRHDEHYFWALLMSEMQPYLEQAGYELKQLYSYADLQKELRSPKEIERILVQNGEYLVVTTIA